MVTEHRLSKARACRLVGLSRTVLYRPKVDRLARDREVIDAINDVIAKRPRWGFWKCFDRIRLDGYRFNHKRVHRVYCEMRLNMMSSIYKVQAFDSIASALEEFSICSQSHFSKNMRSMPQSKGMLDPTDISGTLTFLPSDQSR